MPDRAALVRATNELLRHHGALHKRMTAERTAIESQLIPVTPYIMVACAEAWSRWPDMIEVIERALPADEIGRSGRRPGSLVNHVHLWALSNFFLIGRTLLTRLAEFGIGDPPDDTVERTWGVLDFAARASRAYRGDGAMSAWQGRMVVRPYDADVVAELMGGARRVTTDDERRAIGRLSATLYAYLFLLYFDTRVGTGDTGPYDLDDGRRLIVRDFYRLGESEFWWSSVARDVPYRNLTAAFVLDDGVRVEVDDWGTSITDPADYMAHLVAFGLYTTDTPGHGLRPVPAAEHDPLIACVRTAQAAHYRNVAAMTRAEKVTCGAHVYFTFLRAFADAAGLADELDWTVPRDTVGPVYDAIDAIDWSSLPPPDPDAEFYPPYEEQP